MTALEGWGTVESALPGFQMVPANCVCKGREERKRQGVFSPLYLLKVSWSFRVRIQFLGPCLTSLHLYRPVFKHSHSGDKGFRMWMPGETTECIAQGLALWSQSAWVASNLGQVFLLSLCLSFLHTESKDIVCSLLCWVNDLRHAVIARGIWYLLITQ